jgi:thymidylate synthase (FAD)
MKIVKQQVILQSKINRDQILKKIEQIGRVCYKSENGTGPDTAPDFVSMLVERGHLSVLEHVSLTVKFVTDRGISHELVRHRIASYSQESTRYCNYKVKSGEIAVVRPGDVVEGSLDDALWIPAVKAAEEAYMCMLACDKAPQVARAVLPNCLKTEIVVTANLREWMLILEQRTSVAAHPDMRRLMRPLLRYLREQLPQIFSEVGDDDEFPPMAELLHHKDDTQVKEAKS